MTFMSEEEKKVAMEIERVKEAICKKDDLGQNTRFERERLEVLRYQYECILFGRTKIQGSEDGSD